MGCQAQSRSLVSSTLNQSDAVRRKADQHTRICGPLLALEGEQMSRGFELPQFKSFWEHQEDNNIQQWNKIVREVNSFRSRMRENQILFMNPISNPDFRISTINREGAYMIMDGIDANDNQSRIIQHMSQLSFRMTIAEGTSQTKGAFGFVHPASEPSDAS